MKETIVAKVDGREIKAEDVQKFINMMPADQQGQFNTDDGFIRVRDELINQELLYLDAIDKGLDKTEEFEKEMEVAKANILKQMAMQEIYKSVEVSEKDAKDYYDGHQDILTEPLAMEASHILVEDEELAKKLEKDLKDEADFAELAKEHSKCPSSAEGGHLGPFGPGMMVPEFDKMAQELPLGEISEPVKTDFGYHIIRVDKREGGAPLAFDEIKDELMTQMKILKQQDQYTQLTTSLRDKHKVELID